MNLRHTTRRDRALALAWVLTTASVVSCAKAPPAPAAPNITIAPPPAVKVNASVTIAAAADVNPDSTGRPSPVVVRLYQLKTDAAFTGADFFPLFDDDQKALGAELVSRDEFVLAPAERRTAELTISTDARYVGAIAAFRDIRNAQWRGLIPTPRQGLTVTVERARIVLTAAEQ